MAACVRASLICIRVSTSSLEPAGLFGPWACGRPSHTTAPNASAPWVPLLAVNPATANPAPLGLYGELRQTGTALPMWSRTPCGTWQTVALGNRTPRLGPLPCPACHLHPSAGLPSTLPVAGFALTTALLQGAKTQLSEPKGTTQVSLQTLGKSGPLMCCALHCAGAELRPPLKFAAMLVLAMLPAISIPLSRPSPATAGGVVWLLLRRPGPVLRWPAGVPAPQHLWYRGLWLVSGDCGWAGW